MTTPESLSLLLSYADSPAYFSSLQYLIVDEVHALMATKRGDLLSLALARLKALAPQMRRIGLSATVADEGGARNWLCGGEEGKIIRAPSRLAPDIAILQPAARIPWAGHMATYAMPEIYEELRRSKMSIVFVNTRAQAELVFQSLWRINEANLKIALHHGSLEHGLRKKVEEKMAQGAIDCVVATSSLDLGLDWADVDLVVQIGAPKGVSRLLQRIGRSNHRLDIPSRAILVPANRFEWLECVAACESARDGTLDGPAPRDGALDVLAQHIFGTACSGPFMADQLYAQILGAWPYRGLSRGDFDSCLAFVADGGYTLKTYDRFRRLSVDEHGRHALERPALARQYRMNVGTIVESPMLKVRRGRQYLGMIEEGFINGLSVGDTFLFGGEILQFDGLRDMVANVSRGKGDSPKIPSYQGGKMPLSTHLSERVRGILADKGAWDVLPMPVRGWLDLQGERSALPKPGHLLVETFARGKQYYMAAYPFAGRNAHQTLGFLLMRRMARRGFSPLGFVATDYALALWSLKPVEDPQSLFSTDLMGEELTEWLEDTPLLKRTFREAAVIAGLIERRLPGQQKTGRQMTFSADLIYDVLYKYERDHILLRAARMDAQGGMIDAGRVSDVLASFEGKIDVRRLKKVSPLSVPLMIEKARESASKKERGDALLEDLEQTLLAEAGLPP